MRKNYFLTLLLTLCVSAFSFGQDLLITGVIDGPLSGGTPKALELYVVNDIADLSIYGVESVTNGNPSSDTPEYTFPADAVTAGTFIYLESVSGSNPTAFSTFFGFSSTYQDGVLSVNGDDPIKLYMNGTAIDVFGEVGTDGTGEPWEYLDGWAYRRDGKTASNTFAVGDWNYSGPNALDGESTNAGATTPFPAGTYNPSGSTDPLIIINTPSDGQVFDSSTTEVSITFTVDNFTLSGDAGGGVSDGSGDGYIVGTAVENGGSPESINIFSLSQPYEELEPGDEITLTAELVDNNGNSLSPVVSATVSFSVLFPCDLQLDTVDATCDNETAGVDTYTATVAFTQGNTASYTTTVVEQGTMNAVGTVGGDDPSSLASGTISITGIPEGTDITVNVVGGSGSSCDLFRNITSPVCVPVTCPAAGAIIITEIMQNPSAVSDSDGEYFEVYNTTGSPIDLQGWILKDTSSASETHAITSSVVVPANGYVVLGTNADSGSNGGVTVDYDYGDDYFLGNGVDDIVLECGGNVIDQVEWDNGATFPDPNGASMELAVDKYDATDNDDGANWAEAVSEIVSGGDLGTPGAINDFVLSTGFEVIEGFAAFPNPVNANQLTIRSANIDDKRVEIFNVLGRQVFNKTFSGTQETFEVSNIASGIYILKVTEGSRISTQKLIIE